MCIFFNILESELVFSGLKIPLWTSWLFSIHVFMFFGQVKFDQQYLNYTTAVYMYIKWGRSFEHWADFIPKLHHTDYLKKTPGSNLTRKGSIGAKLHSGSTMTRKSVSLTWNMTQCWVNRSDPIICQVCGKLTNFRVILDPEWSLAPMDPFRVKFDPGIFRVVLYIKRIPVLWRS